MLPSKVAKLQADLFLERKKGKKKKNGVPSILSHLIGGSGGPGVGKIVKEGRDETVERDKARRAVTKATCPPIARSISSRTETILPQPCTRVPYRDEIFLLFFTF